MFGSAVFVSVGTRSVSAVSNGKADVSVTVSSTCSVNATGTEHTGSIAPGTTSDIGSDSTFTITCNDPDGYVVYAVGAGKGVDGSEAEGNTDLVGVKTSRRIATGTANSGDTSNWYFSLSNPSGLTISSGFDESTVIPSVRTAVASKVSGTSASGGDSFTAKYAAYISSTQVADMYSGKVNYVLFHPSSADAEGKVPEPPKTMQEFGDYCDSMAENDTLTLTDTRDDTEYTVAKLLDGKCWMIENLKIAGKSISSTDSDMESGTFSIPAATAASTFQTSDTNVNNSKAYVDSYGDLYTWYTATAGTGNSSITSDGVNATGSICPKGWKLPTSGSSLSGDFADLVNAYGGNNSTGSTNLRHTPVPGFTYAGYIFYYDGSLLNQGRYGFYWSSTSRSSTFAYVLLLNSSDASPASNANRVYGFSVRCLAR